MNRTPRTPRGRALLAAARALTDRGYRAFPVLIEGGDKAPLKKGYPGSVPFSAEELTRMWWDKATHVGIAMHRDWLTLDVDVKPNKKTGELMKGEEHLRILAEAYEPLPQTLNQWTLTGGRHLPFLRLSLPMATRIASKVALPDGTPSDIDIVHGENRYLVVYDLEVWLTWVGEFPELPALWHPAVVRQSRARTVRDTHTDHELGNHTLEGLVERVSQASEGDRNNTLNAAVFQATALGFRGPLVEGPFRTAAEHCTLHLKEIDATIASATAGALMSQRTAAAWALTAKAHPSLQSRVKYPNLGCVVDAISAVAVLRPTEEGFGLSLRELAERSGVKKDTSGKYIRILVDHELLNPLRWAGPGKAARYCLKFPRDAKHWDSPPSSLSLAVVLRDLDLDQDLDLAPDLEASDGGLSQPLAPELILDRRLAGLRSHSAFLHSKGHPHLPPSCAEILIAIEDGCTTPQQITHVTGRSRETVRTNLKNLMSTGIIDSYSNGARVHLTCSSPLQGLEEWVQSMNIPDRAALKKDRHASERAAHTRRLDRMAAVEDPDRDGRPGDDG